MDKEGWWRTQVLPGTGYRISDTGTHDVPGYPLVFHWYFIGFPL